MKAIGSENLNDNVLYPNYNKSTLNLINTILEYYNVNTKVNSIEKLKEKLKENKLNICLMILDGLGNNSLENASKKGLLNTNKYDVISSVFPPTTVAAINTISSGLAPVEHGWLGWSLYFKEVDKSIDVFRNKFSGTNGDVAVELDYKSLIKYENIFTKIRKINSENDLELNYYCPNTIIDSMDDVNNIKYKSFKQGLKLFKDNIIKKDPNKMSFTYFYCDYPDKLMHIRGANSYLVNKKIERMEKQIKKVYEKVKASTVFIISADHGLTNIKGYVDLRNDDELGKMLKRRPSIETRSAAVWIKDKYKGEFKERFQNKYGNKFLIFSKEEVLTRKLFGDGIPHIKVDSFLGDYLIIAKDMYCIGGDKKPKTFKHKLRYIFKHKVKFKASHAGITREEVEIPLIIL